MPKCFLKVIEKCFKQWLKIFNQPQRWPNFFWLPNSIQWQNNWTTKNFQWLEPVWPGNFHHEKKIVDICLDEWNWHVQMNANIMMNINWAHPVIFDNPNMEQHSKTHLGKRLKDVGNAKKKEKEVVFSAIGALKNTLKTMGVLGRMRREIRVCKKC